MIMLGLRQGVWVGRVSVFLNVRLLVLHNDTAANPSFTSAGAIEPVDKESSPNDGVFAPEILLQTRFCEVPLVTVFTL